METSRVTIAIFKPCKCSDFDGLREHFSMTQETTDLQSVSAAAISYIWGEFDRCYRRIGHWDGDPSRSVRFNLGAEWDLCSFVQRLLQTTQKYGAVWIDQVCLPQDVSDEEWVEVLKTIPQVFKTLPVRALFPGRLCRCLREAFEEYQVAMANPLQDSGSAAYGISKAAGEAYERLRDVITGTECIYANGWNSWINRIWPSEELRYSREISVCWVEDGFAGCRQPGNPDLRPEDLVGIPLLFYREEQLKGMDHEEIIRKMRHRGSRWIQGIWLAIGENLKEYSSTYDNGLITLEQSKSEDMAKFLLGLPMHFGSDSNSLSDLFRFVWACEILARTSRVATYARDYIFSVWADWPSYQPAGGYSKLTCFDLLVDALQKFSFGGQNIFVPSSSPAGLLQSSETPSWSYISALSPNQDQVQDTRDLYRRFFWLNSINTIEQYVPLRIESDCSETMQPQLVQEWIVDNSSVETLEAVLEFKHRVNSDFIVEVARYGASHELYDPYSLLGQEQLSTRDIFNFICLCLNLNRSACINNGLEAICVQRKITTRSWREETCEVTCFGLANWPKLRAARQDGRTTISVSIANERWPFYEAVAIAHDETRFSVAAVWVPLANVCECHGLSRIDADHPNATLI